MKESSQFQDARRKEIIELKSVLCTSEGEIKAIAFEVHPAL